MSGKEPAPSIASSLTQVERPSESDKSASPPGRQHYVYVEPTGKAPNPDAELKEPSKFKQFLHKFQNPAVRRTQEMRDQQKLEQERTGVRKVQVTDVARSSNAWAAGEVGNVGS